MKQPRNPVDGLEVLVNYFDKDIIFTAFAENDIFASNALTLLLNIILKTGVFQVQYKEWDNLSDTQHTLVNVLEKWSKKCRIKDKFTRLAGNTGTRIQY